MQKLFLLAFGVLAVSAAYLKWDLETNKDGTGFDADSLKYHFAIDKLTWLKPNTSYISCIDGRNDNAAFGTPGGDFGEWLVALETYYHNGGDVSTQDKVDALFTQFMTSLGTRKFYWHTDKHVIESLLLNLHLKTIDLLDPIVDQAHLEGMLVDPYYIGCGHVKAIVSNPTLYQATPGLAQKGILAFFHYGWFVDVNRTRLVLEQLSGDHRESAFTSVVVRSSPVPLSPSSANGVDASAGASVITADTTYQPMLTPRRKDGRSSFIFHPDVASAFRMRLASVLLPMFNDTVELAALKSDMDALSQVQASQTLFALAGSLPWFTLRAYIGDAAPIVTPTPCPECPSVGGYIAAVVILVLLLGWAGGYAVFFSCRYWDFIVEKKKKAGDVEKQPIIAAAH